MISRRNFIRQTSLATGAILLPNMAFAGRSKGKKPKVVIIGAGFSGLAAAYYLHQRDVEFVVLESRSRIGGRVFSHTIDEPENLVVELGAEWVGASHTRLQELTKEMGLVLENNQFDSHLVYRGEYFNSKQWDYSEGWKAKFDE